MSHAVRWTRRALNRLDQIGRYIGQDNPAAARRVVSLIATSIARLGDSPALGRPGRLPGTREKVVVGTDYIVAYRVREHDIEILTILHGRQRWPDGL